MYIKSYRNCFLNLEYWKRLFGRRKWKIGNYFKMIFLRFNDQKYIYIISVWDEKKVFSKHTYINLQKDRNIYIFIIFHFLFLNFNSLLYHEDNLK